MTNATSLIHFITWKWHYDQHREFLTTNDSISTFYEYKHIHNKMVEAAHIDIITICPSTCNNAASAQLSFVKGIQKKSVHKSVQPYLFSQNHYIKFHWFLYQLVTLSLSISTYLHHILMKFHMQLFDGYLQYSTEPLQEFNRTNVPKWKPLRTYPHIFRSSSLYDHCIISMYKKTAANRQNYYQLIIS